MAFQLPTRCKPKQKYCKNGGSSKNEALIYVSSFFVNKGWSVKRYFEHSARAFFGVFLH